MREVNWNAVVDAAMRPALAYLHSLPQRRVYTPADPDTVRARLPVTMPQKGIPAEQVVSDLARDLEPFVTAHASGRYFGFVIGGLHPAAYGAELLVATWDQNAGLFAVAPGVAVVEDVAARWLVEVLALPADASVGFVTGGQMATFTCLAAARNDVLAAAGWDVAARGLQGAPAVTVVVKSEHHSTIARALRFLGLGDANAVQVPSDQQARIDPDALADTLAAVNGPTIVCVEAGNVNTGAFDDFQAVADVVAQHRARGHPTWVHVDGAVGLWARAAAPFRHLTAGLDRLDSWSTDAHKLLNVAYDSGIAICRDRTAHRAAMGIHASYLMHAESDTVRDQMDWNPEFSRRARGVPVYAALRSLGRDGVDDLVTHLCAMARRFAELLTASGRARVVNNVVFNQVLVQWQPPRGETSADAYTDWVIARIQRDGTAFFSGTTLHGRRLMRISVSDHATDERDVEAAVAALLRCLDD